MCCNCALTFQNPVGEVRINSQKQLLLEREKKAFTFSQFEILVGIFRRVVTLLKFQIVVRSHYFFRKIF